MSQDTKDRLVALVALAVCAIVGGAIGLVGGDLLLRWLS